MSSEFCHSTEIAELQGPIVVFGAGGFLGASLFRTLSRYRDDCYAVTHRKAIPHRLVEVPRERVLSADVLDKDSLESLFAEYQFRTIFNFSVYGGFSSENEPEKIFATNVQGLVNLVTAAEKHGGFDAFVQGGSSSEYGLNAKAPKEGDVLEPNSDYAVSKVAAAYYVKYLGQVRCLPIIHLRFYSLYGPFESEGRLIPKLLRSGKNKTYPQLVHPDVSRDYVYIEDAVEAAVLAARRGCREAPGEAINIASGEKTTIGELVDEVRKLCDLDQEPTWGEMPNRNWDVPDWYGDPSRAAEVLGWTARTPLAVGLARHLEWQATAQVCPEPEPRRDKLSAVIACYKDGQAIPIMYRRLTKVFEDLNVDYEIIFVNDGSPDDTAAVLENLTSLDDHVIAVEHSRNFGSQAALISGSALASGDAVIWLEGDLQDTPETIPAFYEKWKEGYQVVYGIRDKREGSRLLIFFYRVFYRVFKKLSYIDVPLDAGDFSLLDRVVLNHLLALPEKEQFLRGLRAWVGFKQTGVHYFRPERMFGVSTNNFRKNIWWAKKGIFGFSFVPLEILSYGGMVLTTLSFLALIIQVVGKLLMPHIPHGISTIIVLILFFGGLNLLGISILGDYLAKIFEETKGRPKYIRKLVRFRGKTYTRDFDKLNRRDHSPSL